MAIRTIRNVAVLFALGGATWLCFDQMRVEAGSLAQSVAGTSQTGRPESPSSAPLALLSLTLWTPVGSATPGPFDLLKPQPAVLRVFPPDDFVTVQADVSGPPVARIEYVRMKVVATNVASRATYDGTPPGPAFAVEGRPGVVELTAWMISCSDPGDYRLSVTVTAGAATLAREARFSIRQ